MKKKVIASLLMAFSLATMVGTNTIVANAANLTDSTASSAEDETAGEDATQGVKTEYVTPASIRSTTYSGSETTKVYATKTSSVIITVPKILVVGETSTPGTYDGSFNVKVRGDIAGSQSVNIKPVVTSSLKEVGGKESSTNTSVSLDGKESCDVGANDLLDGNEVILKGQLEVTGLTSGSWQGDLSFNVNLTNGN